MCTALAGGKPDRAPVAPFVWGAEYRWRAIGMEIWELLYGDPEISFEANDRLQQRHAFDWMFVQRFGNGWLKDKRVEQRGARTFFIDPAGVEYEFLKDGHQLVRADRSAFPAANAGIVDRDIRSRGDVDALLEALGRDFYANSTSGDQGWERRLIERYGDSLFMSAEQISPFVDACYALGFETSMMMLIERPELFTYLAETLLEYSLPRYAEAARAGYDGILIVESWASADIISPRQYAQFAFPYQKAAIAAAHAQGLKVVFYTTGAIMPFLEQMRGLGMDALTVEEGRKGAPNDIAEIRRVLGPEQCLFGNFDVEQTLLRGSRDEMRAEVLRQIEGAGRDGAFVMGTGSPICDDTPPEQVDLWIELTHELGAYD